MAYALVTEHMNEQERCAFDAHLLVWDRQDAQASSMPVVPLEEAMAAWGESAEAEMGLLAAIGQDPLETA